MKKLKPKQIELRLSLKKKWFEMTKAGIKKEDYREINEYWIKRLTQYDKNQGFSIDDAIDFIKDRKHYEFKRVHSWLPGFCFPNPYLYNVMTLGYPSSEDSERIVKLYHLHIVVDVGKTEWGAEPDKLYFVIKHGNIVKKTH